MSYADKDFQRLAGKGVFRYNMISAGDRVLVGLSGGKDSLALLEFLQERRPRVPVEYTVIAAHLDMGYEDPTQKEALAAYLDSRSWEAVFEDTDYAPLAHSAANRENPCFLCARLRRKRLFELARDHGCNKIAFGHHRDDLSETLLLNILFSGEISTMMPVQEFFSGLLTVIRPLCMVPEDKIRRFVAGRGLPVIHNPCPSSGSSKREEVKKIIDSLAGTNDKVRGNIFRSLTNVRRDYLPPRDSGPDRAAAGAGRPRRVGRDERRSA